MYPDVLNDNHTRTQVTMVTLSFYKTKIPIISCFGWKYCQRMIDELNNVTKEV